MRLRYQALALVMVMLAQRDCTVTCNCYDDDDDDESTHPLTYDVAVCDAAVQVVGLVAAVFEWTSVSSCYV